MNARPRARRQRWSLRSTLLLAMVAFTLLGWLAGGFITWHMARQTETELRSSGIRHLAGLLLGLSDHELEEIEQSADLPARVAMGRADNNVLQDDYRFQIWSDDGRLLLANFGTGTHAAMARFSWTGLSTVEMDGQTWRVYSLYEPQAKKQIQLAEREASHLSLWQELDQHVMVLMALSLVVVLLPALWVLRQLLKPIQDMAHTLEHRRPENLAPVPTASVPTEVAPMVDALNRLFGRLDDALQRERSFTGIAAHEMRTPLAAIRVLAQVVRSADSFVERDDAIDRLILGADRCTHLLEQLLTLQRLDASMPADMNARVDMADITMEAVSATRAEAARRSVTVSVQIAGSTLRGHAFGVMTLIRNLVSNGIEHSPEGGRVEIVERQEDQDVIVIVDDSGPGIPPESRARAFDRFQRLGAKSGTGVGLGLSIVRTVADAHQATAELGRAPVLGGLRVTVRFAGRAVGEPQSLDPVSEVSVSADEFDAGI